MVFEIKEIKNPKLDKFYKKSMKELEEFFGIKWKYNPPFIILIPDRKTINSLNQEKTEDWLVGWASGRAIYLLDSKNYEKESCHKYSEEEYSATIKHELAHCFTKIISKGLKVPSWLSEGISIYLSGQNKFKNKPEKFVKFLEFYNRGGKGIYGESGFAVGLLVKKYGKKKLLSLVHQCGKSKNEKEFKRLFKRIYGFELNYKNFNVLIK